MLPTLFHIGSFYVPTYGVLVATAFLVGLSITAKLARRFSLPPEKIMNLAVYCAIAGIVGAKLFMFLFDIGDYVRDPGQIFTMATLQAAGVFHGGFIVALIFAYVYLQRAKLPVLKTMDIFAPGIAIGQAIGRLGCFAAGCCWGRVCYLPWGVRFRSDFAAPVPLDKPLHPVQLYESAADLLIFAILYRQIGHAHRRGEIIGLYLVLYSTARFIIEFFREHEQALVGPFSLTQWIALALLVLGTVLLARGRQRQPAASITANSARA
jgi:phosphatidylglycerol:prolipoprotein diacylglycerol transferase